MQELEKILEEIARLKEMYKTSAFSLLDKGNLPCEYDKSDIESAKAQALSEAIAIIRKHMNDGWISVEERMPEEYGEYLVTIVPSAGYLWAKRIIANFSDLMGIVKKPIFYTGEVGKIDFEDITDMVIAWRPLPEPYCPERSE